MKNVKELKDKALRIYGAICEDFDAGHYTSCANLIQKNRELLTSFLSPDQDEKIYKIYAFSIFTMIEDLYLVGKVSEAKDMQEKHEKLLYNHLPSNAKNALEGYETGSIPEMENGVAAESVKLNLDEEKEDLKKDKQSWTDSDKEYETVLKENPKISSNQKTLLLIGFLITFIIVGSCILYYSGLVDPNNVGREEANGFQTEETAPAEEKELEIIEAPAAPPRSVEENTAQYDLLHDSSIDPDVPVDENGFVLPSDSRLLTLEDIKDYDQKMIRLVTNEMFARKGFAFNNTGDYYNFFCQFSWYNPDPDLSVDQAEALFSEIEKTNLLFLLNNEN